ncbi:MAG: hypothetical protein AAF216_00460 [Pseudomonadota bacterium]
MLRATAFLTLASMAFTAPALADGYALRGGHSTVSSLTANAECASRTLITQENGVRVMRSTIDASCQVARATVGEASSPAETNITVNVVVNEDSYGNRRLPRKVPFYERFADRWNR